MMMIIIHCSINYSCFVYLHNVLDKAYRTVVVILITSTLTMEAVYPSETSATSPPDGAHVKNQDNLSTHISATCSVDRTPPGQMWRSAGWWTDNVSGEFRPPSSEQNRFLCARLHSVTFQTTVTSSTTILLIKTFAISDTHGGEYEDFRDVTPCSWNKETTASRGVMCCLHAQGTRKHAGFGEGVTHVHGSVGGAIHRTYDWLCV